ncbi:MAG: LuxR C-terminal-related transcriptional regulator, partial [Caldilineaceae bacterium]
NPALGEELHRRAARWYGRNGYPQDAVEHALQAHDWEFAADQMRTLAHALMLRGEFPLLNRWLDALPLAHIQARPRLAITRGWMLLFRGPLHEIEPLVNDLLDAIEQGPAEVDPALQPSLGEVAALRALGAAFRWEIELCHRLCMQAMRALPPEDAFSRAAVFQSLGRVHQMSRQYEEAALAYRSAISDAQRLGSPYMYLFPLARLAATSLSQGKLGLALQLGRQILQTAHSYGMPNWPITSDADITLAEVLFERNELLAAEHHIRRAVLLAPTRSVEMAALATAMLAHICQALGRQDDAIAQLIEMIRTAWVYNPRLAQMLEAVHVRVALANGSVEEARPWALAREGRHEGPAFLLEYEQVTLVHFYLADHRPRAALAQLADLEQQATHLGSDRLLLQVAVLQAVANAAMNQRSEATAQLTRALQLAEPEGYQRQFLHYGDALTPLLQALAAPRSSAPAGVGPSAERLLAALESGAAGRTGADLHAPLDKLTPREAEILRAMARGASNQEIAELFVLTVGTVKGHVNHILSKVGARNRTEAVARARELGLI